MEQQEIQLAGSEIQVVRPVENSGLAIASLITAIMGLAPIAIILGHMAQVQINRSNGQLMGKGMATAGLIIGYIICGIFLVYFAFMAMFFSYLFLGR